MELWTAFTIGLLGSFHCIGMCGPIALALPFGHPERWRMVGNTLVYNVGRVITYMAMGAVFGVLGKGISLAGYQSTLSIVLGILLLLVAFFSYNLEKHLVAIPVVDKGFLWLKSQLGRLLKARSNPSFFTIGLLNGLLPCGLVYMAIFGAVSTASLPKGILFMGLFGLGTIPMMLSVSLAGNWLSGSFRYKVRKLLPAFLLALSVFFILRGLNVELPTDLYLWETMEDVPMCH